MKTARLKDVELFHRLQRLSDQITLDDCRTLRRAALTLTRWDYLECGDSNDYASWAIERNEETGIPYMVRHPHDANKVFSHRIPDREKGALKRIKAICDRLGLFFYHQGDPRGLPLYVSNEPLPDHNYNRGIGIGE